MPRQIDLNRKAKNKKNINDKKTGKQCLSETLQFQQISKYFYENENIRSDFLIERFTIIRKKMIRNIKNEIYYHI